MLTVKRIRLGILYEGTTMNHITLTKTSLEIMQRHKLQECVLAITRSPQGS